MINGNDVAPTKRVLLDTNILQFLHKTKGDLSEKLSSYIEELSKKSLISAISNFSIFELLDGCPTRTKEKKLLKTIETLIRFEVSSEVLLITARLSTLYRNEKAEYGHIEDGDKIIAATSLLTKSNILTANLRDFPRPFFVEENQTHLISRRARRKNAFVVPTSS